MTSARNQPYQAADMTVAVKLAVETARVWDQRFCVAMQGMTMCFNQLSHACWPACGADRLGSVSASVLVVYYLSHSFDPKKLFEFLDLA